MSARDRLLDAVMADLIGPAGELDEILDQARPGDRYLTGVLYPQLEYETGREASSEEDDDRQGGGDDDAAGPDEPVPMDSIRRPSSMGLSFRVSGPAVRLEATAARYRRRWRDGDAVTETDLGRDRECWIREPVSITSDVSLREGLQPPQPSGVEGLQWWIRCLPAGDTWQVTVILENCLRPRPGRAEMEEASFLQASFRVRLPEGSRLIPRRPARHAGDEDGRSNDLIYRDVQEWAIGHVCSATWNEDGTEVATSWMPSQHVPAMSASGHPRFAAGSVRATGSPTGAFDAARLAALDAAALARSLAVVSTAYRGWLDDLDARLAGNHGLAAAELETARDHLGRARRTAERIERGIETISRSTPARRAFQLAQEAMVRQRRWLERDESATLTWRPFQLAFQLLAIPGLVEPAAASGGPSSERLTMDLLWFPTGGGKTEAYLALIALVMFYRRLRTPGRPDDGAGVAAIMRYTLRLLTVQQFERAARMVLACEHIRRGAVARDDHSLGSVPFSIGLWVGIEATPNTVEDARTVDGRERARQLSRCPACQRPELVWDPDPRGAYVVACRGAGCPLGAGPLPVHTIDELVYAHTPSLVIGTVDKFAQIVRRSETSSLLRGAHGAPPDLIIQDELHLISGPLGTVMGMYEAAIDAICARDGVPPKIIGSTATIRRARDQVLRLFDRSVAQFPPPGFDWRDSCFAVVDEAVPGRLYVGVTTAGRSPKFTLQAVCAALLQRASEPVLDDVARDPFWTLLVYFNSMRELGGAHVMMLDDVNDSIDVYAASHGRSPRSRVEEPLELTSRVPSPEIPDILARLEQAYPDQDVSAVLATNMISVGVDIPRLGLMVVNGQPKSMAEYIQASSRVGRGDVPGLIVTVYNAGRARDRAHYESFQTWHRALYREVEAASVTPFAPRARDRALHAAVVALARHLVPAMRDDPRLTTERREALEVLVQRLIERAQSVEPGELDETVAQVRGLLDRWAARGLLRDYWNDRRPGDSLLVSAEVAATRVALAGTWSGPALPTLNSMREVEAGVRFRVVEGLPREEGGAPDAT